MDEEPLISELEAKGTIHYTLYTKEAFPIRKASLMYMILALEFERLNIVFVRAQHDRDTHR